MFNNEELRSLGEAETRHIPSFAVADQRTVQGEKTMGKLMRRIGTGGVSAIFVGGALLAVGGPAAAATATAQVDGHSTVRTVAVQDPKADPKAVAVHGGSGDPSEGHRHVGERRTDGRPLDPWIADQLAVPDSWIMDQLALFAPSVAVTATP
ncbi:hypothetical protein [Streptomyces sp. NPDC093984]|uniref:hypothetical protein n=1 Tax=Streptomyces sp. NPDC093984 TaxID=3366052 RepID=UPI00382F0572